MPAQGQPGGGQDLPGRRLLGAQQEVEHLGAGRVAPGQGGQVDADEGLGVGRHEGELGEGRLREPGDLGGREHGALRHGRGLAGARGRRSGDRHGRALALAGSEGRERDPGDPRQRS